MSPLFLLSWFIPNVHARSNGSQTIRIESEQYPSSLALDGRLDTGWAAKNSSYGAGEWWELIMGRTTHVDTLSIWPGNLSKGSSSFNQYSRPKVIQLHVDGAPFGDTIRLLDKPGRVDVPVDQDLKNIKIEF